MTWVFVLKPVISVINHEIHRATRVDQLLLLGMVILPLLGNPYDGYIDPHY